MKANGPEEVKIVLMSVSAFRHDLSILNKENAFRLDCLPILNVFSITCILVCSGVGAVDVVRLVDGEGVGRSVVDWGVVDWNSVSWDLVNWGSVGWDVLVSWHGVGRLVVDRGSVGRLDMVVVARVLWRGGASFVRPRVGREPCGVGEVLRCENDQNYVCLRLPTLSVFYGKVQH